MSYEISISPKYQVTIPKEVRKRFPEIVPFNKVIVEVSNNVIQIRPQKKVADLVGILGSPPVSGKGKSITDIRKEAYKMQRKV